MGEVCAKGCRGGGMLLGVKLKGGLLKGQDVQLVVPRLAAKVDRQRSGSCVQLAYLGLLAPQVGGLRPSSCALLACFGLMRSSIGLCCAMLGTFIECHNLLLAWKIRMGDWFFWRMRDGWLVARGAPQEHGIDGLFCSSKESPMPLQVAYVGAEGVCSGPMMAWPDGTRLRTSHWLGDWLNMWAAWDMDFCCSKKRRSKWALGFHESGLV
ncbi:hypothetical protein R6Q59_003542 [Mikania micrantha]